MLEITPTLALEEEELSESFVRASGPGGQNVNKVATAVQLRFDLASNQSLSDDIKQRLGKLAGRRLTSEGILVIEARRFRTRERNRQDARDRLAELVRRALEPPKPRKKTRPSRRAKQSRLNDKKLRSKRKEGRRKPSPDE
jgi:ribosome-associated protein